MYILNVNPTMGIVTRFLVNGIPAEAEDFCIEDPATARFKPKEPDPTIIKHFNIDDREYQTIANDLACKTSRFCVNCD